EAHLYRQCDANDSCRRLQMNRIRWPYVQTASVAQHSQEEGPQHCRCKRIGRVPIQPKFPIVCTCSASVDLDEGAAESGKRGATEDGEKNVGRDALKTGKPI